MKALLASNGIRELTIGGIHYAFNENLLPKCAMVEFFSHVADGGSDHDTEFFISVLVCNGRSCMNIPFYCQTGPVLQQTVILCMVSFLVSFIESCSAASLTAELERLAETNPESLRYHSPPGPQARAAELYKFNMVRKSITDLN